MPNDRGDSQRPESPGAVNPKGQPLEISPEALEILRKAAMPSEFLKVAREFVPGEERLRPSEMERAPVPPEVEEVGEPMPDVTPPPAMETPIEPRREQPPWPEEAPWLEEPPRPGIDVSTWLERPAEPRETPDSGEFTLTDLTFDLSGIAHPTRGLLEWEDVPLGRIVTDTYPVLFQEGGEEPPAEEAGREGEEVAEVPCVTCKLILVYGKSEVYKVKEKKYVPSDSAVQAAHNAAALYFDTHQGDCIRVLHGQWRTTADLTVHRYPGAGREWEESRNNEGDIRKWINAPDREGRQIDCFTHVLAIYHGETQQTTLTVLKWLARYCQAPIRHLYLWSCWGSEKVDLTDSDVTDALKQVQGLKEVRTKRLEKEQKELERRAENLEKQIKTKGPKESPSKTQKETEQRMVKAQIERLKARLKLDCRCNLCLYTAPPLDVVDARRRLADEIDRMKKDATASREQLKRATEALQKIGAGKKEQFAMPLGIEDPDKKMVLLAPKTTMLVYCPFDLDKPAPQEKEIKDLEFFPDVPVKEDTDLIVRGLLR